jgi:hypothetical protein
LSPSSTSASKQSAMSFRNSVIISMTAPSSILSLLALVNSSTSRCLSSPCYGPTPLLRRFALFSSRLQSFIVTIFLQSTWQPIQFSIVVPSILRLTFTLFVKRYILAKFVFYMFPQVHSLPISRLPAASFTDIRSSLNIVSPYVDTAGVIRVYHRFIMFGSLDCNPSLSLSGFLSLKSCTLYKQP